MSFKTVITAVLLLFCGAAAFSDSGDNRSPELWKTYMHGITPENAAKIAFNDIVKHNPASRKFVSKAQSDQLNGEFSFKIKKESNLTVTLPVDTELIRGKKIRLFYFCKAYKAGYNNGWHAPWLILIAKNKAGKNLFSHPAWFHTAGTYPWHCYYVDIFIPKATEKFAVKFYTPNGIAWFSGFAWEPVTKENSYSNNYKQCPVTGSLAPNVYYDQMPEHMTRGYGTKYPFRWMLGSKIGLVGQPDDITTLAGFTCYFKTKGIKKPEHINHGLLHLADAYRLGKRKNLLPPVEDGWLENFRDLLLEAQDPATGYWHDGKSLSLGATFHILNMHFRYHELSRSDRKDIIKPGFALTETVPRADEMIRQTLKQQSSWRDPDGKLRKAGWNTQAYLFTNTPDKSKDKFAMGSTWDAVYLLRLAGRHAKDDATRKQIYNSIKDAYYYFLHKMILPDGNIRLTDISDNPSFSYVAVLFTDFHALERKVSNELPQVKGKVICSDRNITVSARIPDDMDCARVYIAPETLPLEKINDSHLVGIIHKKGGEFFELDPWAVYQKCDAAARLRFGKPILSNKAPKDNYLRYKMSLIKLPLPFTVNGADLQLKGDLKGKKVYISGANWYGEESVPAEIF